MINSHVEQLCEDIRAIWQCTSSPVSLKKIADEEGIELAPGSYGSNFHGLLEYVSAEHCFILHYPNRNSGISYVRARFTVAHELGHYFLKAHRAELMNGNSQKCVVGFLSDDAMEKEADSFAASLLIPRSIMEKHIKVRGYMEAQNIIDMAEELKVSIPCAMIRYVQYATEACSVVMSEMGKVRFHVASDEMAEYGYKFIGWDQAIPRQSAAVKVLEYSSHKVVKSQKGSTRTWYSRRSHSCDVWEESYSLGYNGQVITLLSVIED
jgi:hypothetical protein